MSGSPRGPRRFAGDGPEQRRRTRLGLLATLAAIALPGVALAWQSTSPQQAIRDLGIGIVSFDHGPGSDTRAGGGTRAAQDSITADTLLLLRATTGRRVAARWIHRTDGKRWSYALESREPVRRASLEFEYEVEGLPVDSVTPDARWVRVIYGTTEDGSARRAWIRLVPGLTRFERWTAILRERPLFFDSGVKPEFFGAPGGPALSFPVERLPDGSANYVMHPLEVRAETGWMRVRVSTPSDVCGGPDSVRQATLWVRYLTDRGRPRVWYHTRGC